LVFSKAILLGVGIQQDEIGGKNGFSRRFFRYWQKINFIF